jgi:hypothetical protein
MRLKEGPGIDAVLDGALQILTNGTDSLLGPTFDASRMESSPTFSAQPHDHGRETVVRTGNLERRTPVRSGAFSARST